MGPPTPKKATTRGCPPTITKKRLGTISQTASLFPDCGAASYIILANSGTISSETMLMILIIGLTAGPAVSL